MLSQLTKYGRGLFGGRSANRRQGHLMYRPRRDWKILLGGLLLAAILIAGSATYIFFQIQREEFFKDDLESEAEPVPRLLQNQLWKVVDYYDQRDQQFQSFQDKTPSTFDPS